jgi:hypothetical protein
VSYNIKSPLNGRAAQWVDEHRDQLPIDPEEFFLDLSAAPPSPEEAAAAACSNCGARGGALTPCKAGHLACGDCAIRCPTCQALLCLPCGDRTCPTCRVAREAQPACANCGVRGGSLASCRAGHASCSDCAIPCATCGILRSRDLLLSSAPRTG